MIRDDLTNPGVPAGGPCEVEISLVFEAGTDVKLQALWDALCAIHGDGRVVDAPAGAASVGGQLVRFAWRVQP